MQLLLNLVFVALLIAIVIAFIKAPLEIIRGFVIGLFRKMFFPLAWVYDAWKESRVRDKREESVKELISEKDPNFTIEIPISEFNFYLLIQGDYPEAELVSDLRVAVNSLRIARADFEHHSLKDAQLFKFSSLPYFSQCQGLMRKMSKLYGRDNTFGYIEGQEYKIAVTIDNEEPNLMTGRLQDDRYVIRDIYDMDTKTNAMLVAAHVILNKWLTVEFFQHLIRSSADRQNPGS